MRLSVDSGMFRQMPSVHLAVFPELGLPALPRAATDVYVLLIGGGRTFGHRNIEPKPVAECSQGAVVPSWHGQAELHGQNVSCLILLGTQDYLHINNVLFYARKECKASIVTVLLSRLPPLMPKSFFSRHTEITSEQICRILAKTARA